MQKSSGTHLTDTTLPPFEKERNDALRAKSLREILDLETKRDDFKQEEIALKLDPNARKTLTGRIIQGNRGSRTTENVEQKKIDTLFTQIAFGGLSLQDLYKFTFKIASLAAVFAPSVAAKPSAPDTHADAHNVYDTERVTAMTYAMLKEESSMIAGRESALSEITDPDIYMQELQEFAELANSLEMRPHPLTGQFVHCAERVREIEAANAEKSPLVYPPIHNVSVFRTLAPEQTPDQTLAPKVRPQTLDLVH